jgi:hypothetical protein
MKKASKKVPEIGETVGAQNIVDFLPLGALCGS